MVPQHIQLDEYLGQAFNRMPVAMIVVNQQGAITRVNHLAETTFGYGADELIGQPVECLIPERFRGRHPGYRSGFMAEATARPMGLGRDLSGRRKDGSEFPVEIGINPVETGEGIMVLSVILDLSERKQAEKRIQDALTQKDLLLREVHHRVKNNLQVIHSLLDLQALQLTDHDIIGVLRDSQNRIRSMSLIHQTLYQSSNFARVDFQRFLDELVPSLIESYRSVAGLVNIHIDAHEVKLPINEAIPCGLVINELVSNALKHGFARGLQGTINVSVSALADDEVEISVSNDGHPIPDSLDMAQTGTLGFQLVRLLTRQLDGTLDIQRAQPTRFALRFRVKGDE
ncbi:MAG: PAS domain S-box protein [Hydrogenophaga sp.]|uniref:sensor histidine kinase n=1 Tax=Hydrogenophaga sp. TaxID=1904254 RepID=UPI001DA730BC|nr:histidine kinase dimerization/phosphoacceptor domain -containing protein [Hydrogenophaga sp.]MBX3611325.1 PAS domain S-box protein [Hydrogenophaga sp.]